MGLQHPAFRMDGMSAIRLPTGIRNWKDIVIHGTGGMSHVEVSLQVGFDGIELAPV